jgi:hypothetical protein
MVSRKSVWLLGSVATEPWIALPHVLVWGFFQHNLKEILTKFKAYKINENLDIQASTIFVYLTHSEDRPPLPQLFGMYLPTAELFACFQLYPRVN